MHLLQVFGKIMMSKKVSFANYLEEVVNSLQIQEEEDSEEKSTFYFVVILLPQNLNYFNMFIKLLQEDVTHLVKEVQLSVLQFM